MSISVGNLANKPSDINHSPYREAIVELIRLTDSEHVPPRIKEAIPRLSKCHNKLFCWVPDSEGTFGTARLAAGFYPSNLLCELIEAARALDWPKVGILIHGALPPSEKC